MIICFCCNYRYFNVKTKKTVFAIKLYFTTTFL